MSSASPATIRRTCRGVLPMARKSASSRWRCCTESANVLATTKIATKAASTPKTVRPATMSSRPIASSGDSASPRFAPVSTRRSRPVERGANASRRRRGVGARTREDAEQVDAVAAAAEPRGDVVAEEDGRLAAAIVPGAAAAMPVTVNVPRRRDGQDAHPVAELERAAAARSRVDDDVRRPTRCVAGASAYGVRAALAQPCPTEVAPAAVSGAVRGDRAACA